MSIAACEAIGKNKKVKKVFWILFVAMAGLVMVVVKPVTAQKVVGIITRMGMQGRGFNYLFLYNRS